MEQYIAKKGMEFCPCYIMNGTGDYYSKGNKPNTERKVPHDLTHMWKVKTCISQKSRVEWWLTGAGEKRAR